METKQDSCKCISTKYISFQYDGRTSQTSRDALLIEEKQFHTNTTYESYDTPLPGQSEDAIDGAQFESKKKRRLKHRTSSKVELLQSDQDEKSLSPTPSRQSHGSLDSELERYKLTKEENVLEDFRSPKVSRLSSRSRPSKLTEENVQSRNESVVSRPRSPSPKQLQRLSLVVENDYVMNSHGKTSQSSLSTLHLQEHGEDGQPLSPSLSSKKALSPTQEESIYSKLSSTSVVSPLQENASTKGDIQEQPVIVEDARIETPTPSLSKQPVYGSQVQDKVVSPRMSLTSQLSSPASLPNNAGVYVTEAGRVILPRKDSAVDSPRQSNASDLTLVSNKTGETGNRLLSSPITPHTKLTDGVPNEEKPAEEVNANDLKVTNVYSDSEGTLIFEDEFINLSEQNNDFLEQSVLAANANLEAEERRRRLSRSPNAFANEPPTDVQRMSEPGFVSDAESAKIAGYVDAFKRKRHSSQYSFGSDSGESGPPVIATLNEEADTYALTDSLQRVKKLSDAFPSAIDQDRLKKRSLPPPRFRATESMAEISVVEYNRKKKLKKKRPGSSSVPNKNNSLPPLRARMSLPDVTEESDKV